MNGPCHEQVPSACRWPAWIARRATQSQLVLAVPPELREQFRYTQGQHLTVRATIDGADVRRSYSICSAVQDDTLRIAVKRDPGGVFSTWANDSLAAGDVLEVMPPLGHFNVPLDPSSARHYLGVAAGSGITPLLSIVATTLATEPKSRFTLIYGNRASGTVMFKEALAALKDRYLGRFNLVHVLSREAQDIDLLHGRIDRARADALLAQWVPLADIHTAFVCGPEGMMDDVTEALKARGFPESRIKVERFASSIPRHTHVPTHAPAPGHEECTVTVTLDGATRTYTLDKGKENLLDAGTASRHRAAVFMQGRRVLHVPLPHHRRRGGHGRQFRARGLRGGARLHPRLPELSRDRFGHDHIRRHRYRMTCGHCR